MYLKVVRQDWRGPSYPRLDLLYQPGCTLVSPDWNPDDRPGGGLHFMDAAHAPAWHELAVTIMFPACRGMGQGHLIEVEPIREIAAVLFYPGAGGRDWGVRKARSVKVLREVTRDPVAEGAMTFATREIIRLALLRVQDEAPFFTPFPAPRAGDGGGSCT